MRPTTLRFLPRRGARSGGPHHPLRLLVCLALAASACGGDAAPTAELAASTTIAAEAPVAIAESTTSTTAAAATTTTARTLTAEEALMLAIDEAGIRPDGTEDQALLDAARNLCGSAAQADASFHGPAASAYEESLEVAVFTGGVFQLESRTSVEASRFAALVIETLCPEHVGLLGADSAAWSNVLTADTATAGACWRSAGRFSSQALVVDCAIPHVAEISGVFEAAPETSYPFGPDRDDQAMFTVSETCQSLHREYLGAPSGNISIPIGFGVRSLATSSEEWEAGNRSLICFLGVSVPILVGSVAGQYDALEAAGDGLGLSVTVCTAERFEATLSNSSDTAVAAYVRFSNYYPGGAQHELLVDRLGAGESLVLTKDFPDPGSTPTDCERWSYSVAIVP